MTNEWLPQIETEPILNAQAGHEAGAPAAPGAGPAGETHTSTAKADPQGGEHGGGHASPWTFFFPYSVLAWLIIVILVLIGTRRMRMVPKGLQNFLETIVEALFGIPEQVMGPRGRQYAPFVATFFLYIVVMNIFGLIPFFKPPTANLNITLGMAIVAFVGVQYCGFKAHGFKYLGHFLGPVPFLSFLILPLELVSEFIRPVSLSIRLYGNIFGEEQVVAALANNLNWAIPVVLVPLEVLTSILQAFVFTLLVSVYISLATEKHEEHEEHGETAEAHA